MEEGNKTHPVGHNLVSRVLLIDLDVFQNVYKPTASTTTFRVCKKRPFWGPKNISSKLQENSNPGEVFRGTWVEPSSVARLVPPTGTENTRGGARSKLWDAGSRLQRAEWSSKCHTWNRWELCCHLNPRKMSKTLPSEKLSKNNHKIIIVSIVGNFQDVHLIYTVYIQAKKAAFCLFW